MSDRPRVAPRPQESKPVARRSAVAELEALVGVRVAALSRGDFLKLAERLLTQPLTREQSSPVVAIVLAAQEKGILVRELERLLIASLEARLPRFVGQSSRATSGSEEYAATSAINELLNLGTVSGARYVGEVLEQNAKAYSTERLSDGGLPRTTLVPMIVTLSEMATVPSLAEGFSALAPSLEAATQSLLQNPSGSEWAERLEALSARARAGANRGWLPTR